MHYITPIENLSSMLQRGILSNRRARPLRPQSIAKLEVQTLRARVRIPGGRALHEYANLYICARNPMMFKRAALHEETCVLRVSTDVLDLPDVVITDQNAASGYCRFMPSPSGLAIVDRQMAFADDWRHPGNPAAYYRHRSVKCAEVLVPDAVPPHYIVGAYASGARPERLLTECAPKLPVVINAHIFFR
ncbi:MAG: DUF4433 domain-containing protein [Kiloniellales bacterium]